MSETGKIIPFRGRKPAPLPPEAVRQHPLPWRHEGGFVWDANNRLVGSTVQHEAAEWVTKVVNSQLEPDKLDS
jgi:hypothetical protein